MNNVQKSIAEEEYWRRGVKRNRTNISDGRYIGRSRGRSTVGKDQGQRGAEKVNMW